MEPDLTTIRLRRLYAALMALALIPFCLSGCSMGFTNLHPGENSALYHPLFEDLLTTYDEPHWLWVRGTIAGDLNGNGIVEEEIAIATIQKGDTRKPGPIEAALLVVCEVMPDGQRKAIARTLLFDSDPRPASPKPENDLGALTDAPFTRARAQMVQDKVSLKESVVVYFWSDPTPSSVWYVGFGLEDGKLVKNMEMTLYQTTPGSLTANLDRSIDASALGYQLLFSVAAIPDDVMRKLGPAHEAPLWGHVYARDEEGEYEQADERFGGHYTQLEPAWNQLYLRARLTEMPADELAWFEYHMALLNHYTKNSDMAVIFINTAAKNAKDPILVQAVKKAKAVIDNPDRPWPPKPPVGDK